MTKDTYGQSSEISSKSADLQRSLASKLEAALDVNGSPEYALTWKHWDMQSGPPICALRARARRTSDNAYSGWPTPDTGMNIVDANWPERRRVNAAKYHNNGFGLTLGMAVTLVGWPTPGAMPPSRGGLQANSAKALERRTQGHMLNLDDAATLAGWVTPSTRDWKDTPGMATTGRNPDGSMRTRLDQLPRQAALVLPLGESSIGMPPGGISISSIASTDTRGVLNPAHSRWLQGFPQRWDDYAPTAMPSSRRSRPRSSEVF